MENNIQSNNIQSNTCEIIKIDKLFIKDVLKLKKEYLKIKNKILNEIIQEFNDEFNIKIINN